MCDTIVDTWQDLKVGLYDIRLYGAYHRTEFTVFLEVFAIKERF